MAELRRGGFDGAIYPVNPGYDEVAGLRCYPSIRRCPRPVDLAILGVANARVEQALTDAAAVGGGQRGRRSRRCTRSRRRRSGPARAAARRSPSRHGMALCGGNGMGFMNQDAGACARPGS